MDFQYAVKYLHMQIIYYFVCSHRVFTGFEVMRLRKVCLYLDPYRNRLSYFLRT